MRIAPFDAHYRSRRSVEPLASVILERMDASNRRPEGTQRLVEFIESSYLPRAAERRTPSTISGYRTIFRAHLRSRLGDTRVAEFRSIDGQRLMDALADESRLSHNSLMHVRSFLSAVFAHARREGLVDQNPVAGVACPRGTPATETHAYSLYEVQSILRALGGDARAVVAVAAFAGLRRGEIRGLRWEDIGPDEIRVRRSVWQSHVGGPKTPASRAVVPLLPILARLLEARRCATAGRPDDYVFAARTGAPLRLDNMARRTVVPALRAAGVGWHGWHAFRRGLGTVLHGLGVDDKTVQAILRHADVSTTQRFYVRVHPAAARAAMDRLDHALAPKDWATPWATPGRDAAR